jgi:hypothetical protein
MRLQRGLIIYDPVNYEVLKVITPGKGLVTCQVELDALDRVPRDNVIRTYGPDQTRWFEPCSDRKFEIYERTH